MKPTIPCSCGGTLREGHAESYDATIPLGHPVLVEGRIPGLRCDECGAFAPMGDLLEVIGSLAAVHLVTSDRRLSGRELRFLRRFLFTSTQEELADRLGLSRRTLIRWEDSESLSPDGDLMVRAVCTPPLLERLAERHLREVVRDALGSIRSKKAPKRQRRVRLNSSEVFATDAA